MLLLLIACMTIGISTAAAQVVDEAVEEVYEPDPLEAEAPTITPKPVSASPTGKPPPGYADFTVIDRTIGFRDDTFSAVNIDDDGTIRVSTWEGRTYWSRDDGKTWTESTVIPEVKEIWGFSGQRVLLGHLRASGGSMPSNLDLLPRTGGIEANSRSRELLMGDVFGATRTGGEDGLSLDTPPSLSQWYFSNPLKKQSQIATEGRGIVLGAGLSNRAPRLSLLLTVLKRPIANISMQRLLALTATRYTYIQQVMQHPTDVGRVFAATGYGLYESSDGGVSWFRGFPGMTPAERWIGRIEADPKDPERLYLGTSRGLFMSDNGGDSWTKNTKVPEISIRRIAIDPTDSRFVYAAGWGGVYRSDDYGANFTFAFYHSIPRRRDVLWMEIDPFNPNVAYLGTSDGLMRTRTLRTATISDWEVVSGMRTVNIVIPVVRACSKHPGHLYMMTRADLPTINYIANGPESLVAESWDHGDSWRELAGNRTIGDIRWFTLDPKDSDTVWVAFSRALAKIERVDGRPKPDISSERLTLGTPVLPDVPTMSQVIKAALEHTELEMSEFVKRLDSLRTRNWLPSNFELRGGYGLWKVETKVEDIQFPDSRYINEQSDSEWKLMAWASWSLPSLLYRQDSAPLMRFRELKMINGVRERIMMTVHRNYGELQRLMVQQRYVKNRDLRTRIDEKLRIDYLEAIVDLASGGFLLKWKKAKK